MGLPEPRYGGTPPPTQLTRECRHPKAQAQPLGLPPSVAAWVLLGQGCPHTQALWALEWVLPWAPGMRSVERGGRWGRPDRLAKWVESKGAATLAMNPHRCPPSMLDAT